MAKPEDQKGVRLPIEWRYPHDLVTRYATNILVQDTGDEFIISFFEAHPPVILQPPQETGDVLKGVVVPADCVARIVVSPTRMASMVQALADNLAGHEDRVKRRERKNES